MLVAWHGSAALSLAIGGVRILVDPHLSPPTDYGPWYTANHHAPSWRSFLAVFNPDMVLITHGHFDHFDLHTVRRLVQDTDCGFCASPDVIATIAGEFAPQPGRLCAIEPETGIRLGTLSIRAHRGVHWLTDGEGSAIAAKLAHRPDRYGVMPCGGPPLGFELSAGGQTVYMSGDTEPGGVPDITADLAILCIAGQLRHPVTGDIHTPALTVDDLGPIAARLQARLIIPIHFDLGLFVEPIDPAAVAGVCVGVRSTIVMLPYNEWVELEPDITSAR